MLPQTVTGLDPGESLRLIYEIGIISIWSRLAESPSSRYKHKAEIIIIVNREGASHDLVLEVAASKMQRALGLMFHKEMSEGSGMIFIFPRTRLARIWMKNMVLNLISSSLTKMASSEKYSRTSVRTAICSSLLVPPLDTSLS